MSISKNSPVMGSFAGLFCKVDGVHDELADWLPFFAGAVFALEDDSDELVVFREEDGIAIIVAGDKFDVGNVVGTRSVIFAINNFGNEFKGSLHSVIIGFYLIVSEFAVCWSNSNVGVFGFVGIGRFWCVLFAIFLLDFFGGKSLKIGWDLETEIAKRNVGSGNFVAVAVFDGEAVFAAVHIGDEREDTDDDQRDNCNCANDTSNDAAGFFLWFSRSVFGTSRS